MTDRLLDLDGTVYEEPAEAAISPLDRGFLYGDTVFETLRTYRGVPFRLEAHLDRLEHSASVVGIPWPVPRQTLTSRLEGLLAKSGRETSAIRITLSRGEGDRGLAPRGCDRPRLAILVTPFGGYPEAAYRTGIETTVVATRKVPAACLDPSIKAGNYLSQIQARRELERAGLLEGIQRGVDGQLVSGIISNLFLVEGGRLLTPDLASGCLPGTTRALVLELAAERRIPVEETTLAPEWLASAEEVFFTNSLMECLPVALIDDRRLPAAPGPVTRQLHAALLDTVERQVSGARQAAPGPMSRPGSSAAGERSQSLR